MAMHTGIAIITMDMANTLMAPTTMEAVQGNFGLFYRVSVAFMLLLQTRTPTNISRR